MIRNELCVTFAGNLVSGMELMSMNLDSLKQAEVKLPAVRDQLVNLIENMNETDEPVVLIVHLKGIRESFRRVDGSWTSEIFTISTRLF